jgi:allantoate deiminase
MRRPRASAHRTAAALAVVAAAAVLAAAAAHPAPPHPLPAAAARLTPAARRAILRDEPAARLDHLAGACSDDAPASLTRPYLGPAHARAAAALAAWFVDAGLSEVWVDAVGNVRGRAGGGGDGSGSEGGARPGSPTTTTLLLGSHYDTVPGAGRFDGSLGLVAALAAVKAARAAAAAGGGGDNTTNAGAWPPPGKAVEVVAFADEEGSRFGTTFLGSAALAGTLVGSGALDRSVDEAGVTLGATIAAAAVDRHTVAGHPLAGVRAPAWDAVADVDPAARPAAVRAAVQAASLPPGASVAYVEAHMEQGPSLEAAGARTAVVAGIAAQARWAVAVEGRAGHAGTVPMAGRADAGAAAAEAVGLIERTCTGGGGGGGSSGVQWRRAPSRALAAALSTRPGAALAARWPTLATALARILSPSPPAPSPSALVCTVGAMAFSPGAPNVIPGRAAFTLDVRDATAGGRDAATVRARAAVGTACARRGVACTWTRTHAAPEAVADEGLTSAVEAAARAAGGLMEEVGDAPGAPLLPRRLTSGAGHDAAALVARPATPWAMVFVRDRGGVSHTPVEDVRPGDVAAAGAVLWGVVEGFCGGERGGGM